MSMDLKVKHALRNGNDDPCITFALSHGRTIEVSEPLDPVEMIAALAEGITCLTPDPAHAPDGLRKFADALGAGVIGNILDSELGKEGTEPTRKAQLLVIQLTYDPDDSEPRTNVRITVKLDRGGGPSDAWMALAEAIAAVAIYLHQDPIHVLKFVADHPPSAPDSRQVYHSIACPSSTFPSPGGDA